MHIQTKLTCLHTFLQLKGCGLLDTTYFEAIKRKNFIN